MLKGRSLNRITPILHSAAAFNSAGNLGFKIYFNFDLFFFVFLNNIKQTPKIITAPPINTFLKNYKKNISFQIPVA